MKIRKGFVSNSSSSSFIIVGVQISDDTWDSLDETHQENLDDNWRILAGDEDGIDNGTRVIGTMLSDHCEYGLESDTFELSDMVAQVKHAKAALGESIATIKEGMFIGTRCC